MEMIHDVRIIRLGASHSPRRDHPWMGTSIGWWEGDTLVVETIDQHPAATTAHPRRHLSSRRAR